jgi:hypothetical protein
MLALVLELDASVELTLGLAVQFLTGLASSGPSVTGLQPGRASKTPETASLKFGVFLHCSAVASGYRVNSAQSSTLPLLLVQVSTALCRRSRSQPITKSPW